MSRPRSPAANPRIAGNARTWAAEMRELLRPIRVYGPSTSLCIPWRCWRCQNEWTLEGSAAIGRCTRCHEPRPEAA